MPIKITGVLKEDEVHKLFSNVETLPPIHKEVLDKLLDNNYTKNGEFVGEIFKSMVFFDILFFVLIW